MTILLLWKQTQQTSPHQMTNKHINEEQLDAIMNDPEKEQKMVDFLSDTFNASMAEVNKAYKTFTTDMQQAVPTTRELTKKPTPAFSASQLVPLEGLTEPPKKADAPAYVPPPSEETLSPTKGFAVPDSVIPKKQAFTPKKATVSVNKTLVDAPSLIGLDKHNIGAKNVAATSLKKPAAKKPNGAAKVQPQVAIERRLKERQQRIQDLFKDKGSVS